MNGINSFCVVGRLTADPEIKELDGGNKVVNITLAVDRKYKDKDGNKITDFIPFALWGKQAENISKISKKGSLVNLDGCINIKEIEVDGQKSKSIFLKVENYQHLVAAKECSNNLENIVSDEKVMA